VRSDPRGGINLDYVSWRHNIGSGGRIAVAFAGSVALG
jgi:hypothetical protein